MGAVELVVVVAIAIPVLVVIWGFRVAAGIRSGQDALRARLDAIERTLQRQPPA